jgi:iron complex outermembrane receptor protein
MSIGRGGCVFLLLASAHALAQSGGTLRGTVTLDANGDPLQRATVRLVQLARNVETGPEGEFEFRDVPPGRYDVAVHMHPLSDERRQVDLPAGGTAVVEFRLKLAPMHEHITVTASGKEETTLETFQSVAALETLDLAPKASTSLGEALENETGVAKRSFGPGTSRPVVRGFDGDRVAILQDGMSTGTLSSQSGDHGEPVDVASVERVEVVRGPATLLYGTNALGGVVNIISAHHEVDPHAHQGVRGALSATGGTNNAQGGGNGSFEVGAGKWLLIGSGGGMRTGDYRTPLGKVGNSQTEMVHSTAGIGRFTDKNYFRFTYGVYDGRYGIPPAPAHGPDAEEEPVDEKWRRQNARLTGGLRNLGALLDQFTLHLDYSDWNHKEMAGDRTNTQFFNRVFSYRGVFDQNKRGALSGSFGFQGQRRGYKALGEEALTPPVAQDSLAAFALEQFSWERVRMQFGGRVETNRYNPVGLTSRAFTGFSGSAGLSLPLWKDGAFVTSFSHSYRAPAIEELYNLGPHPGNMAYEVGNPNLKRERAEGFEMAVRQASGPVRGEVNLFYYFLKDYVYLAPAGVYLQGFVKANYTQGDSRYMGAEARMDVALRRDLWLKLGFDSVDAQLRQDRIPLPRIPPIRGRLGLDAHFGGLSLRPELLIANAQHQLSPNETRTAGYATGNLIASYTVATQKVLHSFGVDFFNMTGRLYRNHVSIIKGFAPEIGRGVRFNYTIRWF